MIPTIKDLDLEGKRVLLRAGFDVPTKNSQILNDRRIKATLPTIRAILNSNAKQLVIISHEGRPKGKVVPELSLKPVAERLQELLDQKVTFLKDSINIKIPNDKIILLENLRFHSEEKHNDPKFAKELASYGDVFIEDAFSNLHREDVSVSALPKLFKEKAIGILVEEEIKNLDFQNPKKPFVVISGSAKISGKIELLEVLLKKADKLLIGGGILFTFLKAKGLEIGKSLHEDEAVPIAKHLLDQYGNKIVLATDVVISEDLEGGEAFTVDVDKIPKNMMGLDIGDKSIEAFEEILDAANTIFWNGPLGVFEMPPYDHATREVAEHLAKMKKRVVIGGGDTAEAIDTLSLGHFYSHVSTGGGAALQLISGQKLPGLEVFK